VDYLRSLLALVFVLWAALTVIPTVTLAQPGSIGPYVAFHSLETDDSGESRLRIFRIPVYFTLRQWSAERWGVRLRLEGTIATTDPLRFFDDLLEELRVVNVLPGVEFIFPIGNYHKLKPFFDLGIGTNTATDNINLLGDVGMRTEFLFPADPLVFGLEPGIRLSGNSGDRVDHQVVFNSFISFMALHTINKRIGGFLPDAGAYLEAGYDNLAFEFSSVTLSKSDFTTRYEVGITMGFAHGKPRIGPFPIPRLRLGYRFGDVTGFRFRLGGDWLTVLSEPL
jgi:hypothetical protein